MKGKPGNPDMVMVPPVPKAVGDAVIAEICKREPGLWPEQFFSRLRSREYSDMRGELMWRLHDLGYRNAAIGRYMKVDRTTVTATLLKRYCRIAGTEGRIGDEARREKRRKELERRRARRVLKSMNPNRVYTYQANERVWAQRQEEDLIAAKKAIEARILATVPQDTRSITARLLGDPLPGRSAYDKRA